MTSNSVEHLQELNNYGVNDGGHANSNPRYEFIKKEDEIIFKDECNSYENESKQSITQGMYKYNQEFKMLKETTGKYTSETAWLKQETSDVFLTADLQQSITKGPLLNYTPVGPCLQDDCTVIYNLIKHEYIKDQVDIIKYSIDTQHKVCEVEDQLEQKNINCHVPSQIGPLTEEKPRNNGSCEYLSSYNDDAEESFITQMGENLFKYAIHEHSNNQNHNLVLQLGSTTSQQPSTSEFFNCSFRDNSSRKTSSVRHIKSDKRKTLFKCEICNYSTCQKRDLLAHNRIHTEDKLFKCGICDYSTIGVSHLVRHIRTHTKEKPFKCDHCDYSAAEKNTVVRHIRTHTGDKPFKCEICDYRASVKTTLVRHIRTHKTEKQFRCGMCDYATKVKSTLVRHCRTHMGNLIQHIRIHTQRLRFKCEMCEYSTQRKYILARHCRTHTGDKPFKCEVCDYSTTTKTDLGRHIRTHTREKPFKCEMCSYSASDRSNLGRHFRTHTGVQRFKC